MLQKERHVVEGCTKAVRSWTILGLRIASEGPFHRCFSERGVHWFIDDAARCDAWILKMKQWAALVKTEQ